MARFECCCFAALLVEDSAAAGERGDEAGVPLLALSALRESLLREVLAGVDELLGLATVNGTHGWPALATHQNRRHGEEVVLTDKFLRVDEVEGGLLLVFWGCLELGRGRRRLRCLLALDQIEDRTLVLVSEVHGGDAAGLGLLA